MSRRRSAWWFIGIAVVVAALAVEARAQDAVTIVKEASRAMGADSLRTIEYSGNGYDFVLGQAYNPSSPWPKFVNKTYTRAIDFRTPASKVVDALRTYTDRRLYQSQLAADVARSAPLSGMRAE